MIKGSKECEKQICYTCKLWDKCAHDVAKAFAALFLKDNGIK